MLQRHRRRRGHLVANRVLPRPTLDNSLLGTMPARVTDTRSTAAWGFDSVGVLNSHGVNASRHVYEYDGAKWVPRGALVEPAATNLCLQSEDLSTTWQNARSTDSVNQLAAPDGNTTMDILIEDGTAANTHYIFQEFSSLADNTVYCYSVFCKAKERSEVRLGVRSKSNAFRGVFFDLSAGTKGTVDADIVDSGIEDVGGGIYRCWISYDFLSGVTTPHVSVFLSSGSETITYNGDNASGAYMWGAQVEAGSTPTSYIATTTAAVARTADINTATYSEDAAHWMKISARTGYGAGVLFSRDDGTADERIYVERESDNTIHVKVVDGGVEQADLALAAVADLTAFTVAYRIAASDFAASLDGAAVVTDTGGTLPTVTTDHVGHDWNDTTHWNSTIADIMGGNGGPSDLQLQRMSA